MTQPAATQPTQESGPVLDALNRVAEIGFRRQKVRKTGVATRFEEAQLEKQFDEALDALKKLRGR